MDSIKYFFLNITETEWLFLSFVALALFICISYQKIYLHKNSKETKRLDFILQCGSVFFAIMFASMGMLFTERVSKNCNLIILKQCLLIYKTICKRVAHLALNFAMQHIIKAKNAQII